MSLMLKMQTIAFDIHLALHLGFYSRIDFKVDSDDNIYCLEANTLPGMTPTSLFPQEAAAAGINYAALCDRIVRYEAVR
jgi:D-alanine-D-alanine ligase